MTTAPVLFEYRYGGRRRRLLIVMPLMITGAALSIYAGWFLPDDVKGFDVPRLRRLFKFIAPCTLIGLVPMVALLASTFTHRMRVAITPVSLMRPKPNLLGISRREVEIPLTDIERIAVQPFPLGSMQLLWCYFRSGKRQVLASNMMESDDAFRDFHMRLEAAVAGSRLGRM